MAYQRMAPSFAQSETRSGRDQSMKSSSTMASGRGTFPYHARHVRSSRCVISSKLCEENARIRAGFVVKKEDSLMLDDEGSIVKQPTKGNAHCAACRTKESSTWWKAPKGLSTNILCDACGMCWRKYADLNVRTVREDPPVSVKVKVNESKRDGTPLAAPPAKRARVSTLCLTCSSL